MIDANRARQIATNVVGEKAQRQLETVEAKITKAAEGGSLYCQLEGYLLPQVVKILKELGYHVKSQTARNECWTTISWEEYNVLC